MPPLFAFGSSGGNGSLASAASADRGNPAAIEAAPAVAPSNAAILKNSRRFMRPDCRSLCACLANVCLPDPFMCTLSHFQGLRTFSQDAVVAEPATGRARYAPKRQHFRLFATTYKTQLLHWEPRSPPTPNKLDPASSIRRRPCRISRAIVCNTCDRSSPVRVPSCCVFLPVAAPAHRSEDRGPGESRGSRPSTEHGRKQIICVAIRNSVCPHRRLG